MLCLPQERVKIIIIITIVIIYMYIFLIFTKILEIKRNLLSVLLRPKCFYVQKATLKPGFTGCVQLYTVHEMGWGILIESFLISKLLYIIRYIGVFASIIYFNPFAGFWVIFEKFGWWFAHCVHKMQTAWYSPISLQRRAGRPKLRLFLGRIHGLFWPLFKVYDKILKDHVGGLFTVYCKCKRLDIHPVVCNIEQVWWRKIEG